MLSNEHNKQMCFVCYRVADMPTARVSSVQKPCTDCVVAIGYPLPATERTTTLIGAKLPQLISGQIWNPSAFFAAGMTTAHSA